jgi:hypothetical protein
MAQVPHIRDAGQEHAQPMQRIENSHKMNLSEEILAEPRQDSGDTPQGIAWIDHGIDTIGEPPRCRTCYFC